MTTRIQENEQVNGTKTFSAQVLNAKNMWKYIPIFFVLIALSHTTTYEAGIFISVSFIIINSISFWAIVYNNLFDNLGTMYTYADAAKCIDEHIDKKKRLEEENIKKVTYTKYP